MPEITFDQAREFLDNITSEDRVAIIHHDDADGFCSGILYYDWGKIKGAKIEQFDFSFGKWDKHIDLKPFNKIIITDIAPDGIEEINPPTDKEILCADHHPQDKPIPKEILELVTVDQGYIPSSRTAGELTGLKPWLSLLGSISDAAYLYPENQEFIDKHLKEIGMTLDEFKQNVTSIVTNFLIYFNKDTNKAFEILEGINSIEEIDKLKTQSEPVENEIQKFVEEYETKKERLNDINFYYFEPKFSIKGIVANIISTKTNEEAFIFATPQKETNKITISARTQNDKRDLREILKAGVEGLEESNTGGHKRAVGGILKAEDIDKFKKNIRNFVEHKS